MSTPRGLRNERTSDDYPICPHCYEPIRPTQSTAFQAGYAVHVRCELQREAEAAAAATAGPSRTVLYIEDNEANLRLVERLLERRSGVQLMSAHDGRSGLDLARTHRPDLILLDLHLPDVEGTEVLRAIRQDPAIRSTPVIVLTAEADPDLPAQMLAAGAQAYLLKPIDFDNFFAAIDAILPRGNDPVP
jgi:CheY-like chemotaxis protein